VTGPLRFGLHSGPQNCTIDELRHLWRRADDSGFWWVSVWDHFYPAQTEPTGTCFEAVSCHAALAAHTTNVRCGCLVYAAAYRNPAMLAKVATTIDHLSGGRMELGIGAGWHVDEFQAYGIPFLSPAERLQQMDEAAQIIKALWSQERTTFAGRHFQVTDALLNPKMLQPAPRLWMGTRGPRAIAITARHADAWNAAFLTPEDWGARNAQLTAELEELGRDPASVLRSVNVGLVLAADQAAADAKRAQYDRQFGSSVEAVLGGALYGTPQQAVDKIGAYREAGADLVVVALRAPFDLDGFETFISEVKPAFS
jgi:alkanesulfonate monooxygenase SsuD/methylene tetrahydromethanopterin reductase-like flavin-dependent oxidoreductase (luciferase family)